MRIGIIGSGRIGGTLATLLSRAGHEVTLANRRGPDSLGDQVAELGPAARAGTIDEAAAAGDM
jgi:8-hydroxy-5-deazaflavin:NADPH oxidoreductase